MSWPDTARPEAWLAANAPASAVPRHIAGVMRTLEKRRVSTVTRANINTINSASPLPTSEVLEPSESETMTPTPKITAKIAIQVEIEMRSPRMMKETAAYPLARRML